MIKQYGDLDNAYDELVKHSLAEDNQNIWLVLIDISSQTKLIGDGFNAPDIRALDVIQRLYGLTDSELRRLWLAWSEMASIHTRQNEAKRKLLEAKARNRGRS